jgi:phospholipid/cholesterol/gamma-HCH transport system permease protein
MSTEERQATASLEPSGDHLVLKVGGSWRLTETLPQLEELMPQGKEHHPIRVAPEGLVEWDSSLPVFLLRLRAWCRQHDSNLNLEALPAALKRLFRLIAESEEGEPPVKTRPAEPNPVLAVARRVVSKWRDSVCFVGECAIGMFEVPTERRHFSWKDFFQEMVEAGPKALPIVSLLSFLIGVTFAYEVAKELQRFGAEIWVINGVGLAVLRQTGPLIAAVVLAGRTGAAFAAHIGNMKLAGEIDALEILGVSPISFIVLPRVVALVLMMPLVALYSDLLGILGALVVTVPMLNISVTDYWVQLQSAVALSDLNVGIIKSLVFGLLIALAGTMCGLQSERSSVGVGRAVTAAVVLGIAAIVVADAVFAPILNHLGL